MTQRKYDNYVDSKKEIGRYTERNRKKEAIRDRESNLRQTTPSRGRSSMTLFTQPIRQLRKLRKRLSSQDLDKGSADFLVCQIFSCEDLD